MPGSGIASGFEESTNTGDAILVTDRNANEPSYDGKPADKGRQIMNDPFASEFEVTPPASQAGQPQEKQGDEKVIEIDGPTPDELAEWRADKAAGKIAESFIAEHATDYLPCPRNFEILKKYVEANNLPCTRESLEIALEATRAEIQIPGTKPLQPAPRKPSQSGISDASHSPVIKPTAEQAEQELRTMPLDQLRAKIQREAHARGVRVRDGGRSDDSF